jgi:DNA-binding transcriptional regulator YhcF (GntR family)
MIISGVYKPGDRLPSVREFAGEAGVNPNTMQRAMLELEREGLVYSQRTSGRLITDDKELIERTRNSIAMDKVNEFVNIMEELGYSKKEIAEMVNKSLL